MKINEILKSTRAWAELANIRLNFNEVMMQYSLMNDSCHSVDILKSVISINQWRKLKLQLVNEIILVNSATDKFIQDIKKLGITNDSDLYAKIRKVKYVRQAITNKVNSI